MGNKVAFPKKTAIKHLLLRERAKLKASALFVHSVGGVEGYAFRAGSFSTSGHLLSGGGFISFPIHPSPTMRAARD